MPGRDERWGVWGPFRGPHYVDGDHPAAEGHRKARVDGRRQRAADQAAERQQVPAERVAENVDRVTPGCRFERSIGVVMGDRPEIGRAHV